MLVDTKKILPPAIQVFLVPVILLVVLGILSGLAVRVGFSRIGAQRDEIATARIDENTLSQKERRVHELLSTFLMYASLVLSLFIPLI